MTLTSGQVAEALVVSFRGLVDDREHLAIVFGELPTTRRPLVRVHSECLTGDVLGSTRCDCGPQLHESLDLMHRQGGILLYLRQEGRGIGLYNKLDSYALQDAGLDTYEANRALNFVEDARVYGVAAQMLFALGVQALELLTNNPEKARQLRRAGLPVTCHRTGLHLTEANRHYLQTKARHGHWLPLPEVGQQ